MNTQLSDAIAASWSLPLWPTASLLVACVVYLRGWRLAFRTRPRQLPAWRAACFVAGLATIWLAIASPLDAVGSWLLLAHMVQHLLLMAVAPPLLLLGFPTVPLLRGLPRSWVRGCVGPLLASRVLRSIGHFMTHPATGWIAMNVAYLAWHAPPAYELALRSPIWHEVEHACFLGTSLLFWWNVVQPWPARARWSRWAMVPYLITADLANTALSAVLAFSSHVLYPTYATAPRIFGISPMQDQAAAGAFMWVAGSAIYWVPAIGITFALLSRQQPKRHASGNHTLVTIGGAPAAGRLRAGAAPFDLLHLPLVGSLLRSRYGRQSLQAVAFAVMAVTIAHGLWGHPMAAMNLAGVLPWNVVRALGVLALLFFGNLFCMACPFTLPRELARRLKWARLRWPSRLRGKWIAIALMAAFFYCYERYSLWNDPARTAWLLIGYVGTAFLIDALFQGASFCKYVCPIGHFNFIGGLISPTTLKARSAAVCDSCETRDCIRGNTQQRGCELELYLPQKRSNADCTLCMDCVKACPHDNIGIVARTMTEELLETRATSSLGRISQRVDLAVAAAVLVFAGFANAAVMVEPGAHCLAATARRMPWLATGGGSSLAVLSAFALFLMLLWAVGQGLRVRSGSRSQAFCMGALALVPLGMSMWAAHLLFHLLPAVPSLGPLLQQAVHDALPHRIAMPRWQMPPWRLGESVLELQLLVLDVGALVSVYVLWRMTHAHAIGVARRLIQFGPLALLTLLLWGSGFWLLLQPMQMRGMMMGGM